MKRFLMTVMTIILSVAILVPGTMPALADTEQSAELAPIKRGLAIRTPRIAAVGQPVKMMTVERHSHRPVAKVDIYAVKIELIRKITAEATEKDYSSLLRRYTSAATENGLLIGTTDENGLLIHKFGNPGKYVLIAVRDGFIPGFGRISIEETARRALKIRAPSRARLGQPVKIMVLERFSLEPHPVAEAKVYAFQINNLEIAELKKAVINIDGTKNQLIEKYAAIAQENGALIGKTDSNGILIHEFNDSGLYILIAIKEGYIPGFSRILITQANQKALKIRNPSTAHVGKKVTITVLEGLTLRPVEPTKVPTIKEEASTSTTSSKPLQVQSVPALKAKTSIAAQSVTAVSPGQTKPTIRVNTAQAVALKPVAGARVYAVKMVDATLSKEVPDLAIKPGEAVEKYAERIKTRGIPIGITNERGQVVHSFESTGPYIIIAIKDGYYPGRSKINIVKQVKKALHIQAPATAVIKRPVTILVTERLSINPVTQIKPAPFPGDNITSATQGLKPMPAIEARPVAQKPVPDADVYAILIQSISTTDEPTIAVPETTLQSVESYAELAKERGTHIGKTDDQGKLAHSFLRPGRYILLTTKEGYFPGFTGIYVRPLTAEAIEKLPDSNNESQQ